MTESVIFAAAGGGLLDIARDTGEQFGFNTSLFISQLISFLIVAFLLHRFAYKPILKVLEARREEIAVGRRCQRHHHFWLARLGPGKPGHRL